VKEKKLAGLSPFERFESLAKALVGVPSAELKKKPKEKTALVPKKRG
jgi:hypothetical protein